MKPIPLLALFLASALITRSTPIQQQPLIPDPPLAESKPGKLSIPGDSPITHCDDPATDLFAIDRIDLLPNPPQRGQSVVLEITGAFRQDVGDDPQFMLNATYGSVRSIDTVEKLCDHVDIVQDQALSCPPRKGKAVITSTFFIHELMIPPGNYTLRADVSTKGDERLLCIFAAVRLT